MRLKLKLEKNIEVLCDKNKNKALEIVDELRKDNEAYTGWVNWPNSIQEELIARMGLVAKDVRNKCNKLIVVGIGGSYLGTAALSDAVGGHKKGYPEILFAGNNLSGNYHAKFKKIVEENETCICVISKSGTTMETRLAFNFLKELLYEKYGKLETAKRIIAITDATSGSLRQEVNDEGYESFEIPGDIGGRYSAFTPGTLFPLAVSGFNIRELIKGASDIQLEEKWWTQEGVKYALARYALIEEGKLIEVFEAYDPSLRLLGEWCKQLFGESEGKDGQGLFPASLTFSTDLHSMGQFLQEGHQMFFETVIDVLTWDDDIKIPASAGEELAGKSLNEINRMAIQGVVEAHRKADIPIIKIEIEDNKEYCLGQLLYFFMMTAAITGKLMGVDPFNQPGVEAYKSEIKKLLGQ